MTEKFPFGYFESFTKRSNQAVRWKKNIEKKAGKQTVKRYNRSMLRFYAEMGLYPRAAESAVRMNGVDFLSIRSTKPFCQFTLMTRSLVPHIKISKHAFKELSREGYMVSIRKV